MKFLLQLFLILPVSVWSQTKPEEYFHEVTHDFGVSSTKDDSRFSGAKLDRDFFFIVFPEHNTWIQLPEQVNPDIVRGAKELRVGYLKVKSMDYSSESKNWVECDQYQVVDVTLQQKRIIDVSVCEVHGVRMRREPLPVIYGFPTEEDRETYFKDIETHPHGMNVAFQGCIVPDPPYKFAKQFVCPVCRKIFLEKMKAEQVVGGDRPR